MPQLLLRLKEQGIDAKVNYTRAGEAKGISYELDGIAFSGTKLGAAYTFPGLQKHRNISYESERDDEAIKALNSRPPANPNDSQQPQVQSRQKISHVSDEQRGRAEQIYPIAWKIFQKAQRLRKTLEESPGIWSYRGESYALYHVRESASFSVWNKDRGELARYEAGELQSAQGIQQQDLETLRQHSEAQQRRFLLEKQQQLQQQTKAKDIDYER